MPKCSIIIPVYNVAGMAKSARNANVEVFRCLLMFLIVLGHAFQHGIWGESAGWWTLLFSTLIVWHVDGFVSISGWFGIRFSWMKLLRLWGLCVWWPPGARGNVTLVLP